MVSIQPVIASCGTNTGLRNTTGKKMMKLEFTAAGLPVFSAMAYGKPL